MTNPANQFNDPGTIVKFRPPQSTATRAKRLKVAAQQYGMALLSCGVTLLIALTLQSYSIKLNLTLLVVLAVVLPVWYGGKGPGLLALFILEAVTILSKPIPPPGTTIPNFLFGHFSVIAVFVFLILLVSARERSAQLLKQRSKLLQVTLASIGDGVIATDVDGTVTFVNSTAETLTEWTMNDSLGHRLADVLRLEDEATGQLVDRPAMDVIENGDQVGFLAGDLLLKGRTGKKLPVEVNGSPIRTDKGDVIGTIFVFRDITERRESVAAIHQLNDTLEQRVEERTLKLEAANKELEAFSYSVSHDLRAPLRAIDGFSRIFVEDYSDSIDEEGRRVLQVIRTNAQNMGQLIDDLLAFSRLGRKPIEASPIDMAELANSVGHELCTNHSGSTVHLNVNPIPTIQGDSSLIRQVFVNLVSNAIKYSGPREQIEVEIGATTADNENIYYVRDHGVGFDMKYSNKLFGVFQRLHGPEEFEGSGVGLAIVHRIINRHGGRVWAESEVDKGSTFYFALPRNGSTDPEVING